MLQRGKLLGHLSQQNQQLFNQFLFIGSQHQPPISEVFARNCLRENVRKHASFTADKKHIANQIRRTTHRLKVKKLNKQQSLDKITHRQSREDEQQHLEIMNPSKSFHEFITKARAEHAGLKTQMKLFSNSVSEKSKASIQRSINNQLIKIDQNKMTYLQGIKRCTRKRKSKQKQKQKSKEKQDNEKLSSVKKFTMNYMILEKFLSVIAQNPKYLYLRNENGRMYTNLKQKMIEALIQNEKILSSIKFLNEKMVLSQIKSFTFNRQKLSNMHLSRKPFYLLKEQKKDQLTEQIQFFMQNLKSMIQQSVQNFGKSKNECDFEQDWKHEENNLVKGIKSKGSNKNLSMRKTMFEKLTIK